MNMLQIKYFITAATCLNFTQAADLLYITQPALSRQISAMEKALNLQLFLRTSRALRLTPAGKVLFEDLQHLHQHYLQAVERAVSVQHGLSGRLRVGILDGTQVDDLLPPVMALFAKEYPYVEISLEYHSFNSLASMLYDGGLDLALTLYFDIQDRFNLRFQVLEQGRDHIALLRSHPLAQRDFVHLSDLREETFIIVAHNDSAKSPHLILSACQAQGFTPKVRFSPSIQTSMLWVQAGLGITMLDSRNMLRSYPHIKFLDVDQVSDPSLTAAWHQDSDNPALPIFLSALGGKIQWRCGDAPHFPDVIPSACWR